MDPNNPLKNNSENNKFSVNFNPEMAGEKKETATETNLEDSVETGEGVNDKKTDDGFENSENNSEDKSEDDSEKEGDELEEEEETEKVVTKLIEDEMKTAYITYAMAVIVGRALPDVRDGLKPVHRRILYAMQDLGMFHNKPSKKCARIVGEVLGKYHPHGDSAVYDSLVRMAQDFSLRYPLIKGQGNFGSIDGDSAASMRYTEAKLNKIAEEMLKDLEKDTVNFRDNFDASLKEPTVLPSKIPNLLMNGSSGIAVGMATNIPPHNLNELCLAIVRMIEEPDVSVEEIMKLIPGPDFPTGGDVYVGGSLAQAYAKGKGRVIIKSVSNIEENKNGSKKIVVSEIPYQVNKENLIIAIANLVKEKKIEGIRDINDESDRDGIRVVISLKKDADSNVVLNQLYKFSNLRVSFNLNMLALVNNEPKMLSLKDFLSHYIAHRKEVVTRRTQFELNKAQDRLHVLEGLLIALLNLDEVIPGIRNSNTTADARNFLIEKFNLTLIQAKAILDLKLQKLASLEREKIKNEHDELKKVVEELKAILASESRIFGIIKDETNEIAEKFGGPRRSKIVFNEDDVLDVEDLIEEEKVVVTLTNSNYLKRLPIDTYKIQNRGGKGVIAAALKEGDFTKEVFVCSTHSWLLLFTTKGKVHWIKTYRIPQGTRQSKGKHISNIVELGSEEQISAIIPIANFEQEGFLFMATAKGTVKKTDLQSFSKPRNGGIRAIEINEGDTLIGVKLSSGNDNVLLVTKNGYANRFVETNVRSMGRTARGVRGIRLRANDSVVSVLVSSEDKQILTITEKGYGKKSKMTDYRLSNRGGKGVINLKVTGKNGVVVKGILVEGDEGLMLVSKEGIAIRMMVKNVPTIGRATQGVRLMRFKVGNDKVAAVALIEVDESEVTDDIVENGDGLIVEIDSGKESMGLDGENVQNDGVN